jgi:hypothetical protein
LTFTTWLGSIRQSAGRAEDRASVSAAGLSGAAGAASSPGGAAGGAVAVAAEMGRVGAEEASLALNA